MYRYQITVNVQLQSEGGQYRFVKFELEVKGDQQISLEQIFVKAETEAQKKWPDFLKIQNLRIFREEITQVCAIKPEKRLVPKPPPKE